MSGFIAKLRPHLTYLNFVTASAASGTFSGSVFLMNEVSRSETATVGSTAWAGVLGGAAGFVGGTLFACAWPIGIAAVGFHALNRPQTIVPSGYSSEQKRIYPN